MVPDFRTGRRAAAPGMQATTEPEQAFGGTIIPDWMRF
jgi:hypothetical protein